jgi:hypothetical protein
VRGNEALALGAFLLVNLGIWMLVLASAGPRGSWLFLGGRLVEAVGVILFSAHAWPRVKGFGN